jgi:hypothetical protein
MTQQPEQPEMPKEAELGAVEYQTARDNVLRELRAAKMSVELNNLILGFLECKLSQFDLSSGAKKDADKM